MGSLIDLPYDVFVSYKRERRSVAEHLASVIRAYGYSVWYDYDLIPGHDFPSQIERRLQAAKIVLVLWCTKSVTSEWVLKEATLGRDRGLLAPIMIEPCNLPEGFDLHHIVILSEWDGSPRSHLLDPLWDLIEARTGRDLASTKQVRAYERTWRSLNALSLRSLIGSIGDGGSSTTTAVQHNPSEFSEAERITLIAASKMWLEVRDTGDPTRLRAFEHDFATTHFAEQARTLRLAIEQAYVVESQKSASDAEIGVFRGEGRIPLEVPLSEGAPGSGLRRWFSPRGGANEWFRDHASGPEMVVVPAGEFVMGSRDHTREGPVRSVVVARPFAVSRCTITFDDWEAAYKLGGVPHVPECMGWGRGLRPAINISWREAVGYCEWLSRITGLIYRLLSEAEWEYIARASSKTSYWQGAQISESDANFDHGDTSHAQRAHRRTCTVFEYTPNPWGFYQTQGNVWEWVADAWHHDHLGASSGPEERHGGDTTCRVVRGGSWSSSREALRSSHRERFPVDHRDYNVGFRVMRAI